MTDRGRETVWSKANASPPYDFYTSRLKVFLRNNPGALANVCTVIGKSGANISDIKFNLRSHDYFQIFFDLEVQNIKQLNGLLSDIKLLDSINDVTRG